MCAVDAPAGAYQAAGPEGAPRLERSESGLVTRGARYAMMAVRLVFSMPSLTPRAATFLAILVGGIGGVVVALRGSRPARHHVARLPSSLPAPASAPPTPVTSANHAPDLGKARDAAPDAPAGSIITGIEAQLPANEATVLGAGLLCARGKVAACFQVARAYSLGQGVHADFERARFFRWRGLNMLLSECHDKNPEACYALSHLYRKGEGVPKSERQADNWLARTRFLCTFTTSPICSRFRDGGA